MDVPWVAALFEGVTPPWHREDDKDDDEEGTVKSTKWFLNYV